MTNFWEGIVSIAIAIVGVALLAVLVSRNAQTPQVISASGNAFAKALGAAVAPVSGGYGSLGNETMGPSFYS